MKASRKLSKKTRSKISGLFDGRTALLQKEREQYQKNPEVVIDSEALRVINAPIERWTQFDNKWKWVSRSKSTLQLHSSLYLISLWVT